VTETMRERAAHDTRDEHGTTASAGPLAAAELRLIDGYWRAANYLSVGQIYLMGNPLLREPTTWPTV